MLLTLITLISLSFLSLSSYADAESDAMRSAYETKAFYNEQKALHESDAYEAYKVIQENADELRVSVTDDKETAKTIIDAADQFNTDVRRKNIFEKGSVVGNISNEVYAKAAEQQRISLKLNKEDQLYIFISRSMPMELIRSYALDAAQAGGILVIRGLSEEETLNDYIKSDFMEQIKPSGAGAMLQIDPRLFDAFNIELVPSIVFTETSLVDLCNDKGSSALKCTSLDESKYLKIAGSVTTKYALEQMVLHGASGAQRHLNNLSGSNTANPDNPAEIVGLDAETYLNLLGAAEFVAEQSTEFEFIENSNLLKTEIVNTPFGRIEAPKGIRQVIKNIGNIEVVRE